MLSDGETCSNGGDCQSGLCAYSGRQARNICYRPIPQSNGSTCDLHQHCASGFCDYNQGYTCQSKLANGQSGCGFDDTECQSGHCCFDTCQACCGDADCGPYYACHDYTCQKGQWSWHCQSTLDCQDGLVCTLGACRWP